jgi:hypothetical protein
MTWSQMAWPISAASALLSWYRRQIDQISRGVPLDEGLPRLLVAICGAGHQDISRRVIAHRGPILPGGCAQRPIAMS